MATAVVGASVASAAPQLWWGNASNGLGGISRVTLPGSAGTDVIGPTGSTRVYGAVPDVAHNRVYWVDYYDSKVFYANLDGTGGSGSFTAPSSSMAYPQGLAFDPSAGKLYWANAGQSSSDTGSIGWATIDGTSGGRLYASGSPNNPWLDNPAWVAIDPTHGKIYWANNEAASYTAPRFVRANLDGSGGQLAVTPSPTGSSGGLTCDPIPYYGYSVAVDPVAGKLYVGGYGDSGGVVEQMNLDFSGCRRIAAEGTTAHVDDYGWGITQNPAGSTLYWGTNYNNQPSWANLADPFTAGNWGAVNTSVATAALTYPVFVIDAPTSASAPTVAPAPATTGTSLTCTSGGWSDVDNPGMNLWSQPASADAFAWSKDGTPISGANAVTYVPTEAGSYSCSVTAGNVAGETTATSTPVTVTSEAPSPSPSPTPSSPTPATPQGGLPVPVPAPADPVTLPATVLETGLVASPGGRVTLPLTCPVGLAQACSADGALTAQLPSAIASLERTSFATQSAFAVRTKLLASFAGVEIASGTTRLYTLRLAPKPYAALRRAGIKKVRATLRTSNRLGGTGTPVVSTQKVWLHVAPLRRRPAVTG